MEKSYPHVKRHNDLTLNHMGNITLFKPYFHIYIMAPIPIGYGPNPLRVDPIFLHLPLTLSGLNVKGQISFSSILLSY